MNLYNLSKLFVISSQELSFSGQVASFFAIINPSSVYVKFEIIRKFEFYP